MVEGTASTPRPRSFEFVEGSILPLGSVVVAPAGQLVLLVALVAASVVAPARGYRAVVHNFAGGAQMVCGSWVVRYFRRSSDWGDDGRVHHGVSIVDPCALLGGGNLTAEPLNWRGLPEAEVA